MIKRILVIDDDPGVRTFMEKILSRSGYKVMTAEDGRMALDLLYKEKADLIMLDMDMPRMDGLEFLRQKEKSNLPAIPVLMVTGHSDKNTRLESYKLGVYDFITKPEENEVMLKRVENGLKIGEMLKFNEIIKNDLFLAGRMQKYLFPEQDMTNENFAVSSISLPFSDIGGDLYDYIVLRDGRLIFFLADVSGHGISAAMFTTIVKMSFRNALKLSEAPDFILSEMNRDLSANLPEESFVTLFCGLADPYQKKLTYVNAGHPNPVLFSAKGVFPLEGNDTFLGLQDSSKYHREEVNLEKGDQVVVFSDGLTDIVDESWTPVGKSILKKIILSENKTPGEKIDELYSAIQKDDLHLIDDFTLFFLELLC